MKRVVIVGSGPAALFAATLLIEAGVGVDLVEQNDQVGKKLLLAFSSGLNISNEGATAENAFEYYQNKSGLASPFFKKSLAQDGVAQLKRLCESWGMILRQGSGSRLLVDNLDERAFLQRWMTILEHSPLFNLHLSHQLVGLQPQKKQKGGFDLSFLYQGKVVKRRGENVILALGGKSWPLTGSNGNWISFLKGLGVKVNGFEAFNVGFETSWSAKMKIPIENGYIKNCCLSIEQKSVRGDLNLTSYGIEGNPVYLLSSIILKKIKEQGDALLYIDLLPDLNENEVRQKISKQSKKGSLSNNLRKAVGIGSLAFSLLMELSTPPLRGGTLLAHTLKNLKLKLSSARPIEEAISCSGGVCFSQFDDNLMVKQLPGLYCCGEMLDWESPTGGFLVQGCFTTAAVVTKAIIAKQ